MTNLTVDQLMKLYEQLPEPEVTRVLVTRLVIQDEEALMMPHRKWLLVNKRQWSKVEDATGPVKKITGPGGLLGVPVEFVAPDSEREEEIARILAGRHGDI